MSQPVHSCDFVVVGGGIAGTSAGFALAERGSVAILERENQAGYHTTGRSAALYLQSYGTPVVRALTRASRGFLLEPPAGFSEYPILSPRGALFIGRGDQAHALEQAAVEGMRFSETVRRLTASEARQIVPALRGDYVAGGVFEPDAMDIDVHSLHQGYIRGVRRRGGSLATNAEVLTLERIRDQWVVTTATGSWRAPVIINAAGAWCDRLAALAGASPIGLVPKRRTAFTFDPPPAYDTTRWPTVIDVEEHFYFKPEAGKILASPADETPMEPCDAFPDDLDVAIAVERVQASADLPVTRISNKWAGLRSFVADRCPVAGFDPVVPGFFWLAGQGGFGIQTSPAMGRLCASLIAQMGVPDDLARLGLEPADFSPGRLF